MPLLSTSFEEEARVLGNDPDRTAKLIERAYRPTTRLVLGLLSAFGRPVFEFPVIEEDGRLAATLFLSYAARSGWISTVAVDPRWRRRGFARALLAHAHGRIRASGRRYAALDVVASNAPAIALYRSIGYRTLRRKEVFLREPAPAPVAPAAAAASIRPLRRSDEPALAELANARLSPEMRERLPYPPEAFRPRSVLDSWSGAETRAWVAEAEGRPVGFVSASVGGITRSAHLGSPLFEPGRSPGEPAALLSAALGFIADRGGPRVVAELGEEAVEERSALAEAGFAPWTQHLTLGRDLPQ